MPIIRETGFLDLAFAAAGRQITNSENPTVFRIMASSDQLYQTYLVPVVEKIGAKRVAFLGPNDELGKNDGRGAHKAQVDTMKGKGVQSRGRGVTTSAAPRTSGRPCSASSPTSPI